jgi:hypothetical protein
MQESLAAGTRRILTPMMAGDNEGTPVLCSWEVTGGGKTGKRRRPFQSEPDKTLKRTPGQ